MIATLLALLFAFFLGSSEPGLSLIAREGPWTEALQVGLLASSVAIFLCAALIQAICYIPLQKAESGTSPQVLSLWRSSLSVRLSWLVWAATPFAILVIIVLARLTDRPAVILAAFPLLGLAVDAIPLFLMEVRKLLNPFALIYLFNDKAKKAWKAKDDDEVLRCFDALEETGQRALDKSSASLCRSTCQALFKLLSHFIERTPRLQLESLNEEGKERQKQHAQFLLASFFQHLDSLNKKALTTGQSSICHELIATLGKTAVILAQRNIDFAGMPLVHMESIALSALKQDELDIAEKTTAALLAVAKTVAGSVDLEQTNLGPFTISLVDHLDKIAKATFRRDKQTEVFELTRPFNELQAFFKDDELQARSDVEQIQERISVALEEFAALELVLYKLPVGKKQEEEKKKDQET